MIPTQSDDDWSRSSINVNSLVTTSTTTSSESIQSSAMSNTYKTSKNKKPDANVIVQHTMTIQNNGNNKAEDKKVVQILAQLAAIKYQRYYNSNQNFQPIKVETMFGSPISTMTKTPNRDPVVDIFCNQENLQKFEKPETKQSPIEKSNCEYQLSQDISGNDQDLEYQHGVFTNDQQRTIGMRRDQSNQNTMPPLTPITPNLIQLSLPSHQSNENNLNNKTEPKLNINKFQSITYLPISAEKTNQIMVQSMLKLNGSNKKNVKIKKGFLIVIKCKHSQVIIIDIEQKNQTFLV